MIVKKIRSITVFAALLALLSGRSMADQFVITHPSVTVSVGEIREIYLGEKQFVGRVKLVPTDNTWIQEIFLLKVLKMGTSRYETLWIKKSFRDGLTAPSLRQGDNDTLEFVKRTPGAVGYISAARPPTGVNVVTKF